MRTVLNATSRPLRIPLPGGKTLHLGPGKSGRISDRAVQHPAVRRHVEAGDLKITDAPASAARAGDGDAAVHESTHGHPQATSVVVKGNR